MAPFGSSSAKASAADEPDPRVSAILEIAATLGNALDLGELLEGVMLKIAEMLGADRASLFLVDRKLGAVWSRVPVGSSSVEVRLPIGEGIVGYVAEHGALVNVRDAYGDSRFHPEIDRITGYRTGAVLAVPIRGKDSSVIGVAQVLNNARGFMTEDEEIVTSVAPLIGLSIENAKLYSAVLEQNQALETAHRQLRQKMAEVDLLFAIEKELSVADDPNEMLKAILVQAQGTFRARSVAVLLADEGASELRFIAQPGGPVQTQIVSGAREGLIAEILRSPEPLDIAAKHEQPVRTMAGTEARRLLCARLTAHEGRGPARVLGAIEWADPAVGEFSPDDRALAGVVAAQIGRAVTVCRSRVENERTSRLAILGRMLGGLVHDMRSPMTVIGGYAELLSREGDVSTRERYSHQILSQLDQVNAMTRDVLAFIRGERQVLTRRVQLSTFWQDMLPVLTRELEPRHVELKLALEYTGAARLDEAKFQRVITNLVRNAAQAMTNGGTFTVGCSTAGDTLLLRFSDNGPGLPAHVAARLFTAFNSHGKEGGTGLGLALVKEIVEGHGGQVTCTTGEGQGTTFEIRLPHAVAA